MRAAVIKDGKLNVGDRAEPSPVEGQVLVRVRASGINNADLSQLRGRYPAPPGAPQDVPGLELAGEVIETGQRVMALLGGGGHAEFAVVDSRHLLPIPDGVTWEAAGAFVEAFATAHDALFTQAGLAKGERVLITGAAGGVGAAAVQLAHEAGASVVASVRTATQRPRVAELGASVVAPGEQDGVFDVILELVGGESLAADIGLLATGGRLVVIGTSAGSTVEVDFRDVMQRRVRICGSTLRARSAEEKARVVQALGKQALSLLAAGKVTVPIEALFSLEEAPAAYQRFVTPGKFGKIVLQMS